MITKHSGKEWGIFQRSYREIEAMSRFPPFQIKHSWNWTLMFVCLFVMALESFIVIKVSEENVEQENTTTTSSTSAYFSLSIVNRNFILKNCFIYWFVPLRLGNFTNKIKEWQTARNIKFLKRDYSHSGHQLNIAFHNFIILPV